MDKYFRKPAGVLNQPIIPLTTHTHTHKLRASYVTFPLSFKDKLLAVLNVVRAVIKRPPFQPPTPRVFHAPNPLIKGLACVQ